MFALARFAGVCNACPVTSRLTIAGAGHKSAIMRQQCNSLPPVRRSMAHLPGSGGLLLPPTYKVQRSPSAVRDMWKTFRSGPAVDIFSSSPSLDSAGSTGSGSSDEYGMQTPPPSPPPEDSQHQLKATVIREALQKGQLGLGFSAGGFLYGYHLGVLWELRRLGILPDPADPGAVKMAGASAGALAIATFACGLDVPKATQALLEFAHNCRNNGTRARLGVLLRDFLHAYLPDDAHERCRDLTYVAMTRVFPVWRPEQVHRFHDKDDLVQALITSCHIPLYANGSWMTKFRGRYYMDGGVTAFIPRPPTPTVVKVCCFPVHDVLAKVQPRVENYERVASLLDVSISPDAFEDFEHSYQQLLAWALEPGDDKLLMYLLEKGRKDANAWANSLKLVVADEATAATTGSTLQVQGPVQAPSQGLGHGASHGQNQDQQEQVVVVSDVQAGHEVAMKGAQAQRAARSGT